MDIRIRVWLAAEAFLYLPIYAVQEFGILQRIAAVQGNSQIFVDVQPSPLRGDEGCIEHMLAEGVNDKSGRGDIHIAVCDPVEALHVDPNAKRISLLGAFIKNPPFWLLSRQEGEIPNLEVPNGSEFISYNEKFSTGNFLGGETYESLGLDIKDVKFVDFGDEVDHLFDEPLTDRFVLTADIMGMARAINSDPGIRINQTLSTVDQYQSFVTTGLITDRKYILAQREAIGLFLGAVKIACLMLATSEQPTAALCKILARRPGFRDNWIFTEGPVVGHERYRPRRPHS